ncbi:plastocyanin/azurin family copper-binding protein [Pontibacter oryzae]|nr:plastocyanin/azurin family copper-binding protein [Pontibacter oryzae]
MKKRFHTLMPLLLLLLWSCSPPEADGNLNVNDMASDSATAASAPLNEDQDTTLQKIQELSLHALGNSLDEIKFSKDTLEVKAGALVKLTFVNEGVDMPMVHNVVFTAPGKFKQVALAGDKVGASGGYVPENDLVVASSPIALPGQTVEMEFTAPTAPGSYDFVCTYPSHWSKMNGVLIVK